MELLALILGGFILAFVNCYVVSKILEFKINLFELDNMLIMCSYSFLVIINYQFITNGFRLITGLIIMVLIFKTMFQKKLYQTLILSIISYLMLIVSELVFTVFLLVFLKIDPQIFIKYVTGNLLSNMLVSIIFLVTYSIFKNRIKNIAKWFDLKKELIIVIISLIMILYIGIFFFSNYNKGWITDAEFYINVIAIIVFSLSLLFLLIQKSINNRKETEYDQLNQHFKINEQLIDEYHKKQHEYANNLAIIKGLSKKQQDIYINKLLKYDNNKECHWINKLKYIPDGGLKGLLYYKLATIKEKEISVGIDIFEDFQNKKYSNKTYNDICKIVGIYLDNAIEANDNLEKKEIIIEIYVRNKELHIAISNTFLGTVETEGIYKKRYSTKHKNRGFGLSIAEEIINSNNNIRRTTKTINNYFIQEITIK